ncbi:hypothetical protein [Hoeflea prorocentri]|uniref:Uncharacterized protein n=1 Tax=Hoeflea prorocentri TaxID=1922333 RepID=A0A9X3ZIR7_9HYPH|nr:hypothetical protein [Hoeflea prorocentri]MCY6382724.1 hypothetical protein [Hoeflea prorocentri]MDA5400524.1 hypothetical protein [Hoeflea prorocentri]
MFPNRVGDGREARSFKVADLADLDEKAGELRAILSARRDMRDA